MIFLIAYQRECGRISDMLVFEDSERTKADNRRLEMELELLRAGVEREVVLLQASSEEDLRRTHRRYFEDLVGLAELDAVPKA